MFDGDLIKGIAQFDAITPRGGMSLQGNSIDLARFYISFNGREGGGRALC